MTLKHIKGADRLARKFAALPKAYQQTIDKTLEKAAAEMARAARALVPEKTGTLKDSIEHSTGPASDGVGRAAFVMAGVESSRDAFGRFTNPDPEGGDRAFYARFVEFGTKDGSPARPFFWPAFRLMRRLIKKRIKAASRRATRKIAGIK